MPIETAKIRKVCQSERMKETLRHLGKSLPTPWVELGKTGGIE
jgi:hypothetical protein